MANQEGWLLYTRVNDGIKNPQGSFTEVENSELLPDLSNIFVIKYLIPLMSTQTILRHTDVFINIGIADINLLRGILLTKHFCSFLHYFGFSQAKIDLFKD